MSDEVAGDKTPADMARLAAVLYDAGQYGPADDALASARKLLRDSDVTSAAIAADRVVCRVDDNYPDLARKWRQEYLDRADAEETDE